MHCASQFGFAREDTIIGDAFREANSGQLFLNFKATAAQG
jgi:hypothetical protein